MTGPTVPSARARDVRHGGFEEELTYQGFRYTARIARCEQADPRGTATVILGGSSQDRLSWVRLDPALTPLGPVVTVDLPGYGQAGFLPARHGIDFLADTVRHLLEAWNLPRVNMVGACFGGAIALRFAQRHSGRAARLVLVGMTKTIPPAYAGHAARWLEMSAEGRTAEIADELVAQFMSPPDARRPVRRHAAVSRLLHRQFTQRSAEQGAMDLEHTRRLLRHDWYLPLPTPRIPALVLTGEHDTLTTPAIGRQAAGCLEGAWFTTVKEADHLVPVERSDELGDLLARFLSDRPITGLPYCNPPEFIAPVRQPAPAR